MINLKLKNIRQYDNYEISLPTSGAILINGQSGIGKSTIFDSIREALYGGVKNLTSWGKTRHEIYLEFQGMKITRTRGPVSLTVEKDGQIYKDEAAQEEILKSLGMRQTEFDLCSYIKQGSANSLLRLKPAEQQKIIEDLASNGVNVEAVKNIIKEKISNLKKETDIAKNVLESKEESRDAIVIPDAPSAPVFDFNIDEINKNVEKITELRLLKDKTSTHLSNLDNEIRTNQSYYNLERDLHLKRKDTEDRKKAALSKIEKLKNDLDKVPLIDLSEFEKNKDRILKKTEWLNSRNKLIKLSVDLAAIDPGSVNCGKPLGEYILEKIDSTKKDIDTLMGNRAELQIKLTEATTGHNKDPQNCPHCSGELDVYMGKIIKLEGKKIDESLIKELEDSLSSLDVAIKNAQNMCDALVSFHRIGVEAKASFGEDPNPEWKDHQDVQNYVDTINKEKAENDKNILIKTNILAEISSLEKIIIENEESLDKMSKHFQSLTAPRSIDTIEREISISRALLEETEKEIAICQDSVQLKNEYEKAMLSYGHLNEIRNNAIKNREIADQIVAESKRKFDETNKKLALYQRLKSRSDFAASEALDSMVSAINFSAQAFIEKMFDGNTMIGLRSTKTTGSGDEKAQFSTEIFHKGQNVSNIDNLSGGENSRACLAFQLGLSEMYKSPILMIDEGFTGLDPETKEECLDSLRDVAQDKLVLVIEHGTTESIFEEVIELV